MAALIQPLGGMLTAIFVAWVWGKKAALQEITNDGLINFRLGNVWVDVMLKFVAPVIVIIIFLAGIGLV